MTVDAESMKVIGGVLAVLAIVWRQSSFQTEMREGIKSILSTINDLKNDREADRADIRDLRDRVTKLETRCDTNHDGE